ncbi:polysaccharide deacetylase family protein [Ktedonobacteria bacterium brp13]|nr:polysaccharide deacetylase family protein [Ktedonobacteria bacterium brp13]
MIISQMEKPPFRFLARMLCIVTLLMALFTGSALLAGKGAYAASIQGRQGVTAPRVSGASGALTGPHSAATTPGAQVITGGRTDLPWVALTFDDGPNPTYTPQILQVLAANNAHATFFEIGQLVQSNPGLARLVVQNGNVIGNHTWDHPSLTTLTPAAQASELIRASTAIENVTGMTPTLFRPPYGATNAQVEAVAAAQQMATVLWSVDTADWQLPGVQRIVTAALNGAHNGSIIMMHDGGGNRSQTVAALSQIIKGLQARGYALVTVPELVSGTL